MEVLTDIENLVSKLYLDNWRTRRDAIYCLRELGQLAVRAVPDLVRKVFDVDARVASAAATTIISIGPISIPALVRFLHDKDEDENDRNSAAVMLARLGLPAISALQVALQSDDFIVRTSAISCIPLLGDESESFIDNLSQEVLNNDSGAYHAAAAFTQIWLQSRADVKMRLENSIRRAIADSNPEVRVTILRGLEVYGRNVSAFVPEVKLATGDPIAIVRDAAKSALQVIEGRVGEVRYEKHEKEQEEDHT